MKQLLKGGTVVSGSGAQRADVLVEGEKILEVAPDITCPAAKTVDCAGMLLFPGFIDAHLHLLAYELWLRLNRSRRSLTLHIRAEEM